MDYVRMNQWAEEFIAILDEAKRGTLDPRGLDYFRICSWLHTLFHFAALEALDVLTMPDSARKAATTLTDLANAIIPECRPDETA
ncbi:MAG: hypothetical protein J0I06_11790 [Planctomycetes bacterium]|nr:hypothetical protein [Planctomycetota bacterium]